MEEIAINLGAKLDIKKPNMIICDDYESMSQKSADLICEVVDNKPEALLCFPAGNSALRTYEILKNRYDEGKVDFSKARFVQLDEWLDLDDESENSTAFTMKNLYMPLRIQPEKIRLFDIHSEDMVAECKSVDAAIFEKGGIDLILLGLGMNGHLGLNEPGDSFSTYSKVVTLDGTTMNVGQKYSSKPTELTRGVTLGVKHIFDAKKVILQVGGKAKADIVKKTFESRPTIDIPGTVMKLIDNGIVVLDRDAASGL